MNPANEPQPQPPSHPDSLRPGRDPETSITAEEIAEIKKQVRSGGPYFFGEQVQARLKALEDEWERAGGFDVEYMKRFLARLDEDDPPHYRVVRRQR